jgi:hypothetical protein
MRQLEFDFKEYLFVPGGKPLERLKKYFLEYAEKHRFMDIQFASHLALLYHMLLDEKIPLDKQPIKKSIHQLVSGKRVLEIGCRDGSFLEFLKNHGAIVLGSGRNANNLGIPVVNVSMEKIATSVELRDFKPDMVVSMGLLDHGRFVKKNWGKQDVYARVPYRELLRGIRNIATSRTVFFVMPSVDTGATYRYEHLLRRQSLVEHARYQEKGWSPKFRDPYFETHRFKARPRGRAK